MTDMTSRQTNMCDCERGHNGLGIMGRECDCPAGATQSADSEAPALLPCPFCGSAPSLVQALPSGWAVSCAGCGVGSGIRYSLMEDARPLVAEQWNRRAALAAAPQPAPEQGMTRAEVGQMLDAKRHDREALVAAVRNARVSWANDGNSESCPDEAIADWLIEHGLRLPSGEAKPRRCAECDCEGGEYECTWIKPGPDRDNALQQLADLGQQADRASETMAWAVVGEDGEVIPGSIYPTRDEAERVCDYEGERVVRVAIRVVEGGDDE